MCDDDEGKCREQYPLARFRASSVLGRTFNPRFNPPQHIATIVLQINSRNRVKTVSGWMDTWIFPPQSFSDPSRRGSARVSCSLSHFSGRACSIARPCHTKYRTMFTMIDTIGARAGHATARAPAIHRAFVASDLAKVPLEPAPSPAGADASRARLSRRTRISSRGRRGPSTSPHPWPPPQPRTRRSSCPSPEACSTAARRGG